LALVVVVVVVVALGVAVEEGGDDDDDDDGYLELYTLSCFFVFNSKIHCPCISSVSVSSSSHNSNSCCDSSSSSSSSSRVSIPANISFSKGMACGLLAVIGRYCDLCNSDGMIDGMCAPCDGFHSRDSFPLVFVTVVVIVVVVVDDDDGNGVDGGNADDILLLSLLSL